MYEKRKSDRYCTKPEKYSILIFMDKQKRILAIHDISCVGRCSLTVALPIISAAGLECSLLPTALLSTHTGEFKGYTFLDLSGEMERILDHWATLGLFFDYIYTGYLGSAKQIKTVARAVGMYPDAKLVVDTVMGDNGRLYAGLGDDFPHMMRELSAMADMITPNATEAALLLGEDYAGEPALSEDTEGLLCRLSELTAGGTAVLTGLHRGGETGAAAIAGGTVVSAFAPSVAGSFHGTGDVFASALIACLANGRPIDGALDMAVRFTYSAIKETAEEGRPRRFGVRFESVLPMLADYALRG